MRAVRPAVTRVSQPHKHGKHRGDDDDDDDDGGGGGGGDDDGGDDGRRTSCLVR